jgi:hypothetical protein
LVFVLLDNQSGNSDAAQGTGLRVKLEEVGYAFGGEGKRVSRGRFNDGDDRTEHADFRDVDLMGGWVPGGEEATAQADECSLAGLEGKAVGRTAGIKDEGIDFAAVSEESDAVCANGGDNAFDFRELGIERAVDQLVPIWMNRRRQRAGSQTTHLDGVNDGGKLAGVGIAFGLDGFTDLQRGFEGDVPIVDVDTTGGVLDDGRFVFGEGTGDDAVDEDVAPAGFFPGEPMDLFGVCEEG